MKAESEETNADKNILQSRSKENWKLLKEYLFSKDKLKSLSNMNVVDLNLFDKYTENQYIIYKGYNKSIIDYMSVLGTTNMSTTTINKLKIEKPIDSNTSEELLLEFNDEKSNKKIDNTGNIQLWPCEEILSIYCLKNISQFDNKRIIELGSGYSGVCSLFLARESENFKEIYITDGNKKCIETLVKNVELNLINKSGKVKTEIVFWDENYKSTIGKFDFVIISDCLFFTNYHRALSKTINELLSDDGLCIIISPNRGTTMSDFIKLANELFDIKIQNDLIDFVYNRGLSITYSANLIFLSKKRK